MRGIGVVAAAACVLSCGKNPLEIYAAPSHSLTVSVGEEIKLKLSTIGPGSYASPPEVAGEAVEFIEMTLIGPFTPGGPNQQFRFRAERRGDAVVRFVHTENTSVVTDTIHVR
jgi:hypothetical protein